MRLVLVGLSHKTAPLETREKLAAYPHEAVYAHLRQTGWEGAVVLSTCNRFEVLLSDAGKPTKELRAWLGSFLEQLAGVPVGDWLYAHEDAAAIEHLFRVAAGLESLVVGEAEILGQVKSAYETARAAGTADKIVNVLFQRAFNVGKSVRNQTLIAGGRTSVASVAVTLAERIFGELTHSSVLILGAGKMAELSGRYLLSSKVKTLYIANRTAEKGRELAERYHAEPILWEDFPAMLATVDIVIGSTGSDKPVVTRAMVREAMAQRRGRSLFFIDIAMPRDIEEGTHEIEHAYVYTMDDLRGIVEENLARRRGEIEQAAALVREKAQEFAGWLKAHREGKQVPLRHKGDLESRIENQESR